MTNTNASRTPANGGAQPNSDAVDLVRREVRNLLTQSQAFQSLPLEKQREIAKQTVEVASYLAAPEGIPGNKLQASAQSQAAPGSGDPYSFGLANNGVARRMSSGLAEGKFVAQGAREGAAVAGALLQAVNFPEFVSGLIKGVFHAIVQSSIEQMEAYGKLVADVAKTLNQFRDENVSVNQGRDHLVDQFPDLFQIDIDTGFEGGPGPRVRLRDDIDESDAVRRVNNMPIEGGPISSLDDDTIEGKLVPAARTQLATSRQQLLATMVLMGINRIVVTDGKISAKVMYDFQARDNFKFQRSATKFDYAKDAMGNLQMTNTSEGEYDLSSEGGERSYTRGEGGGIEERDPSYYSKGKYKHTQAPVMKLASATQETTDAALQTKASLAGVVEVNFKSDYFPLEKMADSFQIAQIQNAAQPGRPQTAAGNAANTQQPAGAAPAQPATGNQAGGQPSAPPPQR
jgi:hypothetical protein